MKTLLTISLCLLIMIQVFSTTPVEYHGNLSVNGSSIVDKNNEPVCFAGPSLFWSNTGWEGEKFYTEEIVYRVAGEWQSPIIRAAMGIETDGGYIEDYSNQTRVETVINAAIDTGIYVIIDWHSHQAQDYEDEAIEFFEEMATLYGEFPNIIYEIYNEPDYESWEHDVRPYAEAVIEAIRAIDPDNLIVVGSPYWSQAIPTNAPIRGYENIVYSLHFYAGSHGDNLRQIAISAIDAGLAIMVTEWGTVNADGDGDVAEESVQEWVELMKEYNLTNCNWSICDKSEGASIFSYGNDFEGEWTDDVYTPSGLLVRDLILNWEGNYVHSPEIKEESIQIYSIDKSTFIELPLGEIFHSLKIFSYDGRIISEHKIINNKISEDIVLNDGELFLFHFSSYTDNITLKYIK